MKNLLLSLLLLTSFSLTAQSVDTTIILNQVDSLLKLGVKIGKTRDFEKAKLIGIQTEEFVRKNLGKDHPRYIDCLSFLGKSNQYLYQFEQADSLLKEAMSSAEKIVGKEDSRYARCLAELGFLTEMQGQFNEAEKWYKQALSLRKKILGTEHQDYARSLQDLAFVYMNTGRNEEAITIFEEVLVIKEKLVGKLHRSYLGTKINLATQLSIMSRFGEAEPLLLQVKKTFEDDIKDINNPSYLNCIGNLGNVYKELGRFEESEAINLKAIELKQKLYGEDTDFIGGNLNNLGNIYSKLNRFDEAVEAYKKAIPLYEKSVGKEHPDYSIPLQNLGNVYQKIGKYEEAEPLLLETLEIRGNTWGKAHPYYSETLDNLGRLYSSMNNNEEAERLFLEALTLREQILGKENQYYLMTAFNLGNQYWQYNEQQSSHFFQEGLKSLYAIFKQAVSHSSEQDLYALEQYQLPRLDNFYSFVQTHQSTPELSEEVYNSSLFFKGFLLETQQRMQKSIINSDINTLKVYKEWIGLRQNLATEYSKPISQRTNVEELEDEANSLEKKLAGTVADFKDAIQEINYKVVQNSLKTNEIAIEFVHYHFQNPYPTDSIQYAAILLPAGQESPIFIPLFEEQSLKALIEKKQSNQLDFINNLYQTSSNDSKLYDLIWKPLESYLKGIQTIYFAPSGLLHRINFGAIRKDKNESLADNLQLIQLNSTRELCNSNDFENITNSAELFGGIEYDIDTTVLAVKFEASLNNTNFGAGRGELTFNSAHPDLRGESWKPLHWTAVETETLDLILQDNGFKTKLHIGENATEETFRKIGQDSPSPRTLHIATHGYFFPDPNSIDNKQLAINNQDEPIFKMSEHPMIRSGLILAGANQVWEGGEVPEGREDGILTAYEISQMNLSNTELVVLSACETGLGDIEGNEGVYGLQRAFKIAGAKYLIMSLWQVPDFQTQELMTTFYTEWLEGKKSIPEAFRSAQKQMKERFPEPFYWAGFVLVE